MLTQIKQGIEREVGNYAKAFVQPPLSKLPAEYSKVIEAFVRRKGKRIRSVLFVLGYRGYTAKRARYLYKSAAALELLHDFILIHDDLIDHASTRRGFASMHASLEAQLNGKEAGRRFKGSDLALIVGDMLYAMALQGFMAIQEAPERKQKALAQLTETALYTGCGELDELLHTLKPLSKIDVDDIYRIYDWKTGHYTFSAPLYMGATLAGAPAREVKTLAYIGQELGRAFQIKDDLLDLYGDGDRFGKPGLIDLREGKKTVMVWYTYHHCRPKARRELERVLATTRPRKSDVRQAAAIIEASGAAQFAETQMREMVERALAAIDKTRMRRDVKTFLARYAETLLQPPVLVDA